MQYSNLTMFLFLSLVIVCTKYYVELDYFLVKYFLCITIYVNFGLARQCFKNCFYFILAKNCKFYFNFIFYCSFNFGANVYYQFINFLHKVY